jgi:hypothetical protein
MLVLGITWTLVCGGCSAPNPRANEPALGATRTPTSTSTPRQTATPVVYPTATPVPPPPYELTRIAWEEGQWYLHGANLPWLNWGCDFGCGANGGLSSPDSTQAVSTAFATARAAGMSVVRWWMFPGEPSQFVLGADGAAASLKPAVYADIDAALRLAEVHDIYLVFVLFSAPTHLPAAWTNDSDQRGQLAAVVGSLAARYGDNSRVMAWEVFNEPEWEIWNGNVRQEDVVDSVNAIAEQIHSQSDALVTVGSANIEALGIWADSELDFYQPHWYDPMAPRACARCTDYASLRLTYGLNRPVVIGEFYADTSVDSAARYEDFYAKGYAGAWAWSLLPERTSDNLAIDFEAARGFGAGVDDIGP